MRITKSGKYKFEKTEIWNADRTAAKFLYELVRKFRKENKYSYPPDLPNFEEWQRIVRKMEWSFKEQLKKKHYPDIGKYDDNEKFAKAVEKYEAKLQEGVDLFAKYFSTLWS